MSIDDSFPKFSLPSPGFLAASTGLDWAQALAMQLDYFDGGRGRPHGPATAAVTLVVRGLLPAGDREAAPASPEILLIRRPGEPGDPAERHPGQIAFPGGRLDPGDAGDSRVAALRELSEEVGLSGGFDVFGTLPKLLTGASLHVLQPWVVSLTIAEAPLRLQIDEVEEARWVAISDFVSDRVYSRERLERPSGSGKGKISVELPVFDLRVQLGERWRVWGATALILENFLRRLELVVAQKRT
jgi:8-oxo-dGTP pyrophosphatase MutT (NUDIX family)